MNDYAAFLDAKSQLRTRDGFAPVFMPSFLFGFQGALTEWAVEQGRSAILADCGMGKTAMLLVWAENVRRHTNGRVLVLTPLAVGGQTQREADKFGVTAHRSGDGRAHPDITITNYERLHLFNPSDFVGCVCDESSILKSYDGVRRQEITDFMRKMRYRLLDTATAAPNDYTELGTSSEALGYLGHMDMLNRFFKNDLNNSAGGRAWGSAVKWRFKGHAEEPFWKWVCSWARALRKPSDLGFPDDGFILPALEEREHVVRSRTTPAGWLFSVDAVTLQEQRDERRRTIPERCEKAAQLAAHKDPVILWCHLNEEGDLLERLIPDAIQVSGKDTDEAKEEKLLAFASGQARALVIKPKIGAWGLNFQHCAHIITFPSHSFEQYYQSVRRCWRFGQLRDVVVDVVTTEGEVRVVENMQRKQVQADEMFSRLVAHMNDVLRIRADRDYPMTEEIPAWL